MRVLFEKRVHKFISKDNDQLIKEMLTKGVQQLRSGPEPRRRPRLTSATATESAAC